MSFALTKYRKIYHWYVPHVPKGDDPLEALLLGETRCEQEVVEVVSRWTRPSPISNHQSVEAALLDGLCCAPCWEGTDTLNQLQSLRKAQRYG